MPLFAIAQNGYTLRLHTLQSNGQSIIETNQFPDTIQRAAFINQKLQYYFAQGYVYAAIIQLNDSATIKTASIQLQEKYYWNSLKLSKQAAQFLTSFEPQIQTLATQALDPSKIEILFDKILTYTENNGYPLASLQFDSIKINDQRIDATINLITGNLIKIDSVTVSDPTVISPVFLAAYIGLKNGSFYNQRKINLISERINQLDFLTLRYNPIIVQGEDKIKLVISPERRNQNQADGLVGLIPSANGKANFIGQFHLNLKNVFKRGELIDFNFKGQPNNTRDLNLKFNYDYLLGSFISTELLFSIRRQDTSFVTVTQNYAFPYYFSAKNYLKFFYSNQQTSLISTKSFANLNTLPIFADVNNQQYGIGFKYLHYINEFYPKKGYHITASIAFGNRTIIRNSQVQQNLYDSINLQSIQFNANLAAALYLPLAKRSVLYWGTQFQHIAATNLFQNELIRYGGLQSLRGFNEESLFAATFALFNFEYRLLLDSKTFMHLFFDQAIAKNPMATQTKITQPFGFGLGLNIASKTGVFSVTYALGKTNSAPINYSNGKIHFGVINYF
jgi:outer membrane translocation and assembly module TamA